MLKSANHLSKVQKVKVREKDTEAMLAEYNVSIELYGVVYICTRLIPCFRSAHQVC